jgi:hypothetical protein
VTQDRKGKDASRNDQIKPLSWVWDRKILRWGLPSLPLNLSNSSWTLRMVWNSGFSTHFHTGP